MLSETEIVTIKQKAMTAHNVYAVIRFVLYAIALCVAVFIPGILMLGDDAPCIIQDEYPAGHIAFYLMLVAILVGMFIGTITCCVAPRGGLVYAVFGFVFVVLSAILIVVYIASLVMRIVELGIVTYPCTAGVAIVWIGLITAIVLMVVEGVSSGVVLKKLIGTTVSAPVRTVAASKAAEAVPLTSVSTEDTATVVPSNSPAAAPPVVFRTSKARFMGGLFNKNPSQPPGTTLPLSV